VGFTTYYSSLGITKIFAAKLKSRNPDMKIILGGPSVAHFAKNTEELLQQYYVDAIYLGEGENALVEYLRAVDQKSGRMLPGVAYKNREKIVLALPFHYNKKLDDLPFPDFSGLNLSAYNAVTRFPSYTSRGCPNKCFYCSDRNLPRSEVQS